VRNAKRENDIYFFFVFDVSNNVTCYRDELRNREKNGKLTRRFANRVKRIGRKDKEELI
jgi:hypothetical protein